MIEKVQEFWKAIVVVVAILTVGSASGVWAYHINQQVAAGVSWRDTRDLERLDRIRRKFGLDHIQWITWCKLRARVLRVRRCREFRPNPPNGRAK